MNTIVYIHDPMCSWCYGFNPVLNKIINTFKKSHHITYILGGLAADSNKTMPESMQTQIQSNWQRIEKNIPGIKFNYHFWSSCNPMRSTYPSCRAVICAKNQNAEIEMIKAIQSGYYAEALNPSDYETLYFFAKQLNLDISKFKTDIHSDKTELDLQQQITLCREIGADSFPSLYLLKHNKYHHIEIDYNDADISIEHIKSFESL